jgi:choline dehydrogenase-like flavoprotein
MGTARMGRDPATSVVNPDCAVHEHANLLIVDGSVFPTSAGLNPSLTMQALSFRAADRLLAAMKEGKI